MLLSDFFSNTKIRLIENVKLKIDKELHNLSKRGVHFLVFSISILHFPLKFDQGAVANQSE